MSTSQSVYVQGLAVHTSWHDASLSLTDLIFGCVAEAVADSGIPMEKIHSVVLAAHDIVDGRSLSSMVTAPAAGAYFRDEIRLAEDGLAALSLAAARIESREAEYSIVAAWGRASEGNYQHTSRTGFDPFEVQPLGLDEFGISSLRLSGWLSRYGDASGDRVRAVAERAKRAARNPRAVSGGTRPQVNAPLRSDEAPCFGDIAVAMIIGHTESSVKLRSVGHSAETAAIGARDLVTMPALAEAVGRACASAGIELETVDLFEIAGATLADEAIALEAIGLAKPGQAFSSYAERADVNPSGGSARGWCFPTTGLLNAAEAVYQLSGRASGVQLATLPKRALVTGVSPLGGQVAHAAILEAA